LSKYYKKGVSYLHLKEKSLSLKIANIIPQLKVNDIDLKALWLKIYISKISHI